MRIALKVSVAAWFRSNFDRYRSKFDRQSKQPNQIRDAKRPPSNRLQV